MHVYKNTVQPARTKTKKLFAFGRRDDLKGQPTDAGGYAIFTLKGSYDGSVKGGIRKRWVLVARELSFEAACELMNKKLKAKIWGKEAK